MGAPCCMRLVSIHIIETNEQLRTHTRNQEQLRTTQENYENGN